MEVQTCILGPFQTNTYLLQENGKILLIDPASKAEKIISLLGNRKPEAILLTHGHFDHIKAVDGLYRQYCCPVYLHEADETLARNKYSGASFGLSAYISCPIEHLKEGKMQIGPFDFEVIFTPGHTRGSVIYVFDDCIFTGDTLFKGSIGRTDLEGGSDREMKQSLQIFRQFDKDYDIYPGHDFPTKLSYELTNNYYLNR